MNTGKLSLRSPLCFLTSAHVTRTFSWPHSLPSSLRDFILFLLTKAESWLLLVPPPPPSQPAQSLRTTKGPLPPRSRCRSLCAALAKWLKSRHPPQSRIFIKNQVSGLPLFSPSRIRIHKLHPLKKGKAQLFPLCCSNDLQGLGF